MIHLIFRKKLPQYNSIEQLFQWILPALEEQDEIKIHELPFSGAGFKAILGNIKYIRQQKLRQEVVHITGHENVVAPFCGKHLVMTIHDVGSALKGNFLKRFLMKLFWFWIPALFAKKITVISEFSALEVKRLIPFAKNKIEVVYNPINPQLQYHPRTNFNEPAEILFIGTKPNKNLERTIDALKKLPIKLTIVGKLNDWQKQLLSDSGLNYINEVFIPYERMIALYQNADILLFPSLYEGFGLPILEAQSIGVPVITSNVASMPEVAGDAALLINPHKTESIRESVQQLMANPEQRALLVKAGLKNIERFSDIEVAQKYHAVYNQV